MRTLLPVVVDVRPQCSFLRVCVCVDKSLITVREVNRSYIAIGCTLL